MLAESRFLRRRLICLCCARREAKGRKNRQHGYPLVTVDVYGTPAREASVTIESAAPGYERIVRYTSVTGRSRFHDEPIKGSRFIATLFEVSTDEAAQQALAAVCKEMADARHHCWAYRLHAEDRIRSSDDGEPGGSAGRPILAQIEGHGLHDTMVVVTRYFGGVKLGVGGLIRAYGGCAGRGLDRAELKVVIAKTELSLEHEYGDTSAIDGVIRQEGLTRSSAEYDELVRLVLEVPAEDLARVRQALIDRTSGRVVLSE